MVRMFFRIPVPLGFDLFWTSPEEIGLITDPRWPDVFEIRSIKGLVVWKERNTPVFIIKGKACARSTTREGCLVLEFISQDNLSSRATEVGVSHHAPGGKFMNATRPSPCLNGGAGPTP